MRVTAVGLCGSDLHWYEDGGIGFDKVVSPLVLGHEMGGVIAAGPREGMRVVIEPANPCGHCAACRAGDANLCPSVKFCGHAPIDGALRTYMAWPQRLLLSIPDSIADDDVPLLEPLGIALHALDLVGNGTKPGELPLGQVARRAGHVAHRLVEVTTSR